MSTFELNVAALYAALDEYRKTVGIDWRDVAKETGLSPSTFSRMVQGHRPDADGLCSMVMWLGVSLRQFVRTTQRAPVGGKGRTDAD